jgi:hypothetical protein
VQCAPHRPRPDDAGAERRLDVGGRRAAAADADPEHRGAAVLRLEEPDGAQDRDRRGRRGGGEALGAQAGAADGRGGQAARSSAGGGGRRRETTFDTPLPAIETP